MAKAGAFRPRTPEGICKAKKEGAGEGPFVIDQKWMARP